MKFTSAKKLMMNGLIPILFGIPFIILTLTLFAQEKLPSNDNIFKKYLINDNDNQELLSILKKAVGIEPLPKLTDELKSKIETTIKDLENDDWNKRELATLYLIDIGPIALPFIKKLEEHPDKEVRARINRILSSVKFLDINQKPEPERREIITNIMTVMYSKILSIKDEPIKWDFFTACLNLLQKDKDWFIRKHAIVILGEAQYFQAINPLLEALSKDNSADVRVSVAIALGKINTPKAIVPLIERLKDNDSHVRAAVCQVLGNIKDKRAIEPLLNRLKDSGADVRVNALIALYKMEYTKLDEQAINAFDDKEAVVRRAAVEVLKDKKTPEVIKCYVKLLWDTDDNVRTIVSSYIGKLNKDEINSYLKIDDLITALKDPVAKVRGNIVKALGKMNTPKVIEPLIDMLKNDTDSSVRGNAATALIELPDPRSVEPLINALKNDLDVFVRIAAALALGHLKDNRAITPLMEALEATDIGLVDTAAGALSIMKCYRAVDAIIKLLELHNKWLDKSIPMCLINLTGKKFDNKEDNRNPDLWRKWWKENKDYIYWSDKEKKSLIDEEAQKVGIPTGEYRKTHPWPKEDKPKEPDKPK